MDLPVTIVTVIFVMVVSIFLICSAVICWNSCEGEVVSSPPFIYIFNCLLTPVRTDRYLFYYLGYDPTLGALSE